MRYLKYIGLIVAILFPLTGFCITPNESVTKVVGFGDSWLELSQLDVEKHLIYGVSFKQICGLIELHDGGDYDTVVILGGIVEHLRFGISFEGCSKRQELVLSTARKKFPRAKIVIVSVEHMVEALDIYDSGDGVHIKSKEAYSFLFRNYNEVVYQ